MATKFVANLDVSIGEKVCLAHGTSSLRGRGVHNKVDGTWLYEYPLGKCIRFLLSLCLFTYNLRGNFDEGRKIHQLFKNFFGRDKSAATEKFLNSWESLTRDLLVNNKNKTMPNIPIWISPFHYLKNLKNNIFYKSN